MNARPRALFFSDCHLGAGPPQEDRQREARVLSFLENEAPRADAVYVLGDLFDFWFEYRQAVPRSHFRVLRALGRLVDAGARVTFLGGNHDFWAGSFLAAEVGCRVSREPIEVTEQGRRLFLAHGDGMARGDRGYLMLRAVLRNRACIAAYRWLHPDLGIPLARVAARLSRRYRDETRFDAEWLRAQVAAPRFEAGADAVLLGHFHHPTHVRRDGRDFLVLGDWLWNNTFAVLEEGRFSMYRWREGRAERLATAADPAPAAEQPVRV